MNGIDRQLEALENYALSRVSNAAPSSVRNRADDERRFQKPTTGNASHVEAVTRLNLIDPLTVRIEPVEWLIRDMIPFGELTMLDGDGGIGKTTVLLDLVARFTTGAPMPDGSLHPPGKVLVLAEEDRDSILRARLDAAGADLTQTRFIKSVGDDEHRFTLPRDVPALKLAIEEWGAKFVIIDALFNHLDADLSQNRSQDVRTALMPLGEIAHLTGAAIEATRHTGKALNTAANRGLGSVDIKNISRSLLTMGLHPDDEATRVIAVAKTNLGMPCDALTCRLDSVEVSASDGSMFQVARIAWTGTAQIRADALTLSVPDSDDDRTAIEDACELILECLGSGSKTATELTDAVTRKAKPTTFRRARKRLHDNGQIERTGGGGFGGPVVWSLSSHRGSSKPIEAHISKRDSMENDEILCEPPSIENGSDSHFHRGHSNEPCQECGRSAGDHYAA